jgi:hypothetical protein
MTARIVNLQEMLETAVAAQSAGRFEDAVRGYRQVMVVAPAQEDALHLQGVAARRIGRGLEATRLIGRARCVNRRINGVDVNFDNALTDLLNEAGAAAAAGDMDACRRMVAEGLLWADPAPRELLTYAGTVALMLGRDDEAERFCRDAEKTPDLGKGDPSGLRTALDGLSKRRRDFDFAGTVVIPAFRARDYIEAALDSIAAAVRRYHELEGDRSFRVHIAVVDDKSPDDTPDIVRAWATAHPEQSVTLLLNNQNRGAGRSRNAGAEAALGRYLWFLDADDYFLPDHLHLTHKSMEARPDVAYVRTGILFDRIDAQITDAWRKASEFTYPCNLCVRRECHDLIGGFPEEAPFGPAGPEDVAYSRALQRLFACLKTDEKTVFYTMRPGNILDKLHREMQCESSPPGVGVRPEAVHTAVEILIQRRLYALERMTPPPGWRGPVPSPDRRLRVVPFDWSALTAGRSGK